MKLEQFLDAIIIPTNGFALFNDNNRMNMIKNWLESWNYYPY